MYAIKKSFVPLPKEIEQPTNLLINSNGKFIEKIKVENMCENSVLASTEIMSPYPSINVKEIETLIMQLIDNNPAYNDDIKTTLNSSIILITIKNIFQFNGKFYEQIEGVQMGSIILGL